MSQQATTEEMVLVSPNHNHANHVYHTDADCIHVKQCKGSPKEIPRELAERQYRECSVCKGTDNTGRGERTGRECPKCDERAKNLPLHMRSRHGGDS